MNTPNLQLPLVQIARVVEPLGVEDSLQRAADELQESGLTALPVRAQSGIIGQIEEVSIAKALAAGLDATSAVGSIVSAAPPSIGMHATGAEALRLMVDSGASYLLVVDTAGLLVGIVSPSDLTKTQSEPPRPRMVGGMATPFGVYLTSGTVQAGARGWALVATGATLITLFMVANIVARELLLAIHTRWFSLGGNLLPLWMSVLSTALFLLGLRALPLSGIHAAEHMTVHAIERHEPLELAVVARMPRVHPRCGTNLAVALSVFLAISTANWFGDPMVQTLLALVVTATVWRPMGSAMQRYVTTRPPTDRQILMGIKSGKELMDAYAKNPMPTRNLLQRIWNSGVLQLMAGSTAVTLLVELLASNFQALSFLRVYS
jgi:CBS domain-containing protein